MTRIEKDEEREERLHSEIIVDAYGPEEQAISWYYYLDDVMRFPFKARCIVERTISPLREGEEVQVERMAPEEDCEGEMFVLTQWLGRTLGVPLSQLEPIDVDGETAQAVADWHYWTARGYQF